MCNNWEEHSHTFSLEVITRGRIDSSIGTVMSLTELKDLVRKSIVNKLNGKDLNKDVEFFKKTVSINHNK